MNKIIFAFLLSLSAMAQSVGLNQSYLLLDSGEALTVRSYMPAEGIYPMYKPPGFFFVYDTIKLKKSSYLINNDESIFTVDADGNMYRYDDYETDRGIAIYGENFFVSKKGSVYVVKNDGSIFKNSYENRDKKLKIKLAGGNFAITKKDELIMINNTTGDVVLTGITVDHKNITVKGNNYFAMNNGNLYTLGFTKNQDGSYKHQVNIITNGIGHRISLAGGNFFFDKNNYIHTIAMTGYYDLGGIDRKIRVKASKDGVDRSQMVPMLANSNYFIYPDGAVYFTDFNGKFWHLDSLDLSTQRLMIDQER